MGALELRGRQLALGLRGLHLVDERLEAPYARAAEFADGLEHLRELTQVARLQDELVLELLLYDPELLLRLLEHRERGPSGAVLAVDQLHLRPELLDLGPLEVEVERPQLGLDGGEPLADRFQARL